MSETNQSYLPLGICKQAVMKLDSFCTDIREIMEDEEISPEDREQFEKIAEVAGTMEAIIVNMVRREIDEEDFINEQLDPDEIDPFPGSEEEEDLLGMPIE